MARSKLQVRGAEGTRPFMRGILVRSLAARGVPFEIALETATRVRDQLGTRGIGENGCNGATAAVHNAVMDALASFGIEHIDLPLRPERIWRAVAEASS